MGPELVTFSLLREETIHKGLPRKGGGGFAQKTDIGRKVAWILYCILVTNADEGREGVQNPEHFVDVPY